MVRETVLGVAAVSNEFIDKLKIYIRYLLYKRVLIIYLHHNNFLQAATISTVFIDIFIANRKCALINRFTAKYI